MLTIELLEPSRITALWPAIEPMVKTACAGHAIAQDELSSDDIYVMSQTDMCVMFGCFEDNELALIVVIQFYMTGEHKTADIVAMAGRKLMQFKSMFWPSILDWLRANGVKFVDAYAPDRLAKLYMAKFGFGKSCAYVRMSL